MVNGTFGGRLAAGLRNSEAENMVVPESPPQISSAQMRAARSLLDWSREETASKCGVGINTLARFETEGRLPSSRTLAGILAVLSAEGIVFVSDDGTEGVLRRKAP